GRPNLRTSRGLALPDRIAGANWERAPRPSGRRRAAGNHGSRSVKKISLALALGLSLSAAPLMAQTPPPATGAAAVQAGSYKLDANHTQVIWSVDHLGFSKLYGMVGSMS